MVGGRGQTVEAGSTSRERGVVRSATAAPMDGTNLRKRRVCTRWDGNFCDAVKFFFVVVESAVVSVALLIVLTNSPTAANARAQTKSGNHCMWCRRVLPYEHYREQLQTSIPLVAYQEKRALNTARDTRCDAGFR